MTANDTREATDVKRPLRVFHSPVEIAGQMGALVKGLRQAGHTAVGYNTFHTYLNCRSDIVDTDLGSIQQVYERKKHLYDIYHYHFGTTIYPDYHDLRELAEMGKKCVMHHWGNDVRLRAKARLLSPLLDDPCNPWTDAAMIDRTRQASRWIRVAIVQDCELYDYVKDAYAEVHVLPLAFDVGGVTPSYPSPAAHEPLIIHAPTQKAFKGTVHVDAALERLRAEGLRFEYRRIEQLSHEEALRSYQRADLVIDQLLVGTYGTFSVEAMAFGKPVVAHIRPDLADRFPQGLPIISADPASLHDRLIPWITDAQLRHERGRQSRRYAEAVHDLPRVIARLLEIYERVMDGV